MKNHATSIISIHPDAEGKAYEAAEIFFKKSKCLFRKARVTPKKRGMFMSLWERPNPKGGTMPYSEKTDCLGLLVLYQGNQRGYFFFPKQVLVDQGVFSSSDFPGKRAMRLYAPLEKVTAKQAVKTQAWQARYFLSMDDLKEKKSLLGRKYPVFNKSMVFDLIYNIQRRAEERSADL